MATDVSADASVAITPSASLRLVRVPVKQVLPVPLVMTTALRVRTVWGVSCSASASLRARGHVIISTGHVTVRICGWDRYVAYKVK